MPTIGIITSEVGWHSQQIADALVQRGCTVYFAALTEYEFVMTPDKVQPRGFSQSHLLKKPADTQSDNLPDAVFVRCIPKGTFEQVTFYLDILHAFAMKSVQTYNDARAIERSVDKVMTSFLLEQAGLPTPRTWAGVDQQRAHAVIAEQTGAGYALVMKPIFGSQGKGLQYIDAHSPAPAFTAESVYYLQEFIQSGADGWCDWRLFVINHRVVAAMKRVGKSWINNVAQGSTCYAAQPTAAMVELAEAASVAVDTCYAGIDLIEDKVGDCRVIEVNSIPAWQGLQSVVQTNIAGLLADDLLRRLS